MRRFVLPIALAALGLVPPLAHAGPAPLVPREVLFADPEQGEPVISPDGRWLAWSRRDSSGISNLWVRTVGGDSVWQVTHDARGIQTGRWTMDSRQLLYIADYQGNELLHGMSPPFHLDWINAKKTFLKGDLEYGSASQVSRNILHNGGSGTPRCPKYPVVIKSSCHLFT